MREAKLAETPNLPVKSNLDAKNVQYIWRHLFRGVIVRIQKQKNTHMRAAAPQDTTDYGNRGVRGSSNF